MVYHGWSDGLRLPASYFYTHGFPISAIYLDNYVLHGADLVGHALIQIHSEGSIGFLLETGTTFHVLELDNVFGIGHLACEDGSKNPQDGQSGDYDAYSMVAISMDG